MARKSAAAASVLTDTRRAGLDVCDAILDDLCNRGLLAVTPEVLKRLEQHERTLQSYKLSRFSRELAAIRARMATGIRSGGLDAALLADRLSRLYVASAHLRRMLDDPYGDAKVIEELAGHTWRTADLELRENVLMSELAWESIEIEEGFRLDTSYFLARAGEVLCERKIVPLEIRAPIDTTPKPQHPVPRIYAGVGVYPGDLPRRVKILESAAVRSAEAPQRVDHRLVRELLVDAPGSIAGIAASYLQRRLRPFPPDTVPVVLASPRVQWHDSGWRILDAAGAWLEGALAPGIRRRPAAPDCLAAFENCVLSSAVEALLLLLYEKDRRLVAAPVGAVTAETVLRFGFEDDY